MDLSLILLGAAGVFIIIFKVLFQQSTTLRKDIEKLRTKKANIEQALSTLGHEVEMRESRIDGYKRTLGDYGAKQNAPEKKDDYSDLLAKKKGTKIRKPRTLEEFLVKHRFVDAEHMNKALEYKKNTRSEMDIEQILVMFNHITEAKLNSAKAVFAQSKATAKSSQ